MEPIRRTSGEKAREAKGDPVRDDVVDEIVRDARSLKEHYPSETIVPEGGE